MSERFNLYSYGASRYRSTDQQQTPMTQYPIPPASWEQPVRRREDIPNFIPLQRTTPIRPMFPQEELRTALDEEIEDLLGALGPSNIFLSLLNPRGRNPFQQGNGRQGGWSEPVIVRPTQEVIEQNSTLLTSISGQQCAICQEQIQQTENCRRLSCSHTYHRSCIDTWFQRSTRCPTCRHDIREQFRIIDLSNNNI